MFVAALLTALRHWRTRRATLLALSQLDDHTLDDIGRARVLAYAARRGR